MKIRDLFLAGIIVVVWESFFAHTQLLGAFEFFPVIGALTLYDPNIRSIGITFLMGLLASLVAVETIGLMSFAYSFAVLSVLVLDRFSQLISKEMSYLAVILYLSIYKFTIILALFALNGYWDFALVELIFFIVSHSMIVYLLKNLLKPDKKDTSFIV
ncbi:hypothetical protein GF389_00280 [Candidatus Dojkabacteria bacterium]|nr:hypothetical protein [Candidatus Dojkabacteria bacterium]